MRARAKSKAGADAEAAATVRNSARWTVALALGLRVEGGVPVEGAVGPT